MNNALYTDTIQVKSSNSQNDFGQPSGATTTVYGYLQKVTKVNISGNVVGKVTQNLFNTNTLLNDSDKIIFESKTHDIIQIDTIKNHFTGVVDHYEVLF